ncbi:molybdopterin synthase, small subunit CNX7 [Micromonas pusilla CCMP1545]|jgi:molybdopterin converting factor subunit 1|uniref:Molybdopterin synthase sulfur carrier subunit n=2 Tax=Micromonas pusilla TaxID=38833 RepID=C1N4T5_MICPC|nr:molybdopterin synthase, small subunit CNX7 [Micromonas pusilla CCMP1545]EEH52787.1 molybdopterin synthase, small subunit CNX7 [Micromonas pusilla CCMP1545]|tara:strand:+ start:1843 stop:2097 length:255 start_codon:yes stop_codon:yes gene_type:complete|eukprot:XP_003062848.1 molybdopterin synthase, small subunit CNX7 [Micromonas pusilla CCMP1545]
MPRIKVLYFARAREVTGGLADETHDLPDDECHTDALRLALVAKHPGLESVLRTAVFAVNQEYSDGRVSLSERDEVAVIPPISGG